MHEREGGQGLPSLHQPREGFGEVGHIGPGMGDAGRSQGLEHLRGKPAFRHGLREPGIRDARPEEIAGAQGDHPDAMLLRGLFQHLLHLQAHLPLARFRLARGVLIQPGRGCARKDIDIRGEENGRARFLRRGDRMGQHRQAILAPALVVRRIDAMQDQRRAFRRLPHGSRIERIAHLPFHGVRQERTAIGGAAAQCAYRPAPLREGDRDGPPEAPGDAEDERHGRRGKRG